MAFPKNNYKKANFPDWMKEIFSAKKKENEKKKKKEYRCALRFFKRIKENAI